MTTALTTVEADTKLFMESFRQILDKEESDDDAPAPKKQKASSSDQLTIAEALDITFSAFDYYIRIYYDGDISYIDGAKDYGMSVCEKAQELKKEYKERFDVKSVIKAFRRLGHPGQQ